MHAIGDGTFQVEVLGPDGKMLAKSPKALAMSNALIFVEDTVARRFLIHFHWEERQPRIA
jgi:hypothetical protein